MLTSSLSSGEHWAELAEALRPDVIDGEAYVEFVEAVERGAVDGDNSTCLPSLRNHYVVVLDSWAFMRADLLGQLITDAGSIRKAARVLDVPRSTLGAWFRKTKARAPCLVSGRLRSVRGATTASVGTSRVCVEPAA